MPFGCDAGLWGLFWLTANKANFLGVNAPHYVGVLQSPWGFVPLSKYLLASEQT